MGNDCTTCSLNPNNNGDETEYSVDNRLPVSFLHEVEDEDINQEILLNTVDFLKNLDDGKNKTGEIQVPPESDSITYIRSLPIIFQNLYKKIHDKFGYFDTFDISSRKDKFKVEMGPPMEITVLKKNKGKRDEISLHPVTQTKFGPTNVRFEHKTPSRVDRREITMAEIQIPSDLIVKSELHEYYEGEWRKKKYHGFGRLVTVEGHVYEGFFSQGFPWGKGRVLYNNGNYFKGYFERGEYSGQGELYSTNGSYLKGEFFKVYELHKDGSTFDGMYKNGKKNGEGILVLSNRDKIAGEFKDNFLDGKATIEFSNGNHFTGKFTGNRKNGFGVFVYKDGTKFEGKYKLDFRWGDGTLTMKDGGVLEGRWEKGILKGKASYKDSNRKKFSLEFKDGEVLDKKGSDIPQFVKF